LVWPKEELGFDVTQIRPNPEFVFNVLDTKHLIRLQPQDLPDAPMPTTSMALRASQNEDHLVELAQNGSRTAFDQLQSMCC
jgi:hypothetical protein